MHRVHHLWFVELGAEKETRLSLYIVAAGAERARQVALAWLQETEAEGEPVYEVTKVTMLAWELLLDTGEEKCPGMFAPCPF